LLKQMRTVTTGTSNRRRNHGGGREEEMGRKCKERENHFRKSIVLVRCVMGRQTVTTNIATGAKDGRIITCRVLVVMHTVNLAFH